MDPGGLRPISRGDFQPIAQQPDMGPAPMLQWLPVADLVVDERYQRPIYGAGRTNVRRIAEAFRWSKFAPVIVAPIAGGKFAIIDGQHRTTAAHLIGVETVPCLVIIADLQEQAAAFKAVNGQVTRMHNLALQAASLAAGDAAARELQSVAEQAGVTILRYPKMVSSMAPGETMALGAIADGIRLHGAEVTVAALKCVTASKNNRPGMLSGPMIKGLTATVAALEAAPQGDWLFRAFDRINLAAELDEAQVTRRAKGVAVWEVLADRLRPRLGTALGRTASPAPPALSATAAPSPPSPPQVVSQPPAARMPEPGLMPSAGRPQFPPAASAAPAGELRSRILAQLADGACSTQGLATLLDVKELTLGLCLRQLHAEGLVRASADLGPSLRPITWSLPQGAKAVA